LNFYKHNTSEIAPRRNESISPNNLLNVRGSLSKTLKTKPVQAERSK